MADVTVTKTLDVLEGQISAESVAAKALTVVDPVTKTLDVLEGKVCLYPQLDSIDPTSATIESLVTAKGVGFGSVQGDSYVTIGEVQATEYTSWSDTEIVFTVPPGAVTGDVRVWRVDNYE